MDSSGNQIFRDQISEDIKLMQENLSWEENIHKDEYAFNCWVLSNIYNLDEEECVNNITEYNDKCIDCFAHYEEDKELYIIQNKYYSSTNRLSSQEVSDFLTRPLATLNNGNYKNRELQKIYSEAKKGDYTVYLHFYVTNNIRTTDVDAVLKDFSRKDIVARVFYLDDIKEKYYGESFKRNEKLEATIGLVVKASCLAIRPDEYKLPNMLESYYVMAEINDVYEIWHKAKLCNYELFERNIRDYLGGSGGINKAIIETLRNPEDRGNFFYYNNGITIICDRAKAGSEKVEISNPQIVNGCQTVNSIAEVLHPDDSRNNNFKHVYVIVKILVLDKKSKEFYRTIVKYSNSQNAINEKVFGATQEPFFRMQKEIRKLGFLLIVKQSDKNTFKEDYKDKKSKGQLLELANKNSAVNFFQFERRLDVQIHLETLIQIIGAFKIDAHFAYARKSSLLKKNTKSKYYEEFSTQIANFFTFDSMVKLIVLYKKSECDKKNSSDKKSPSPYYLLNFLGYYLGTLGVDKQAFLNRVSMEQLAFIYRFFKSLPSRYYNSYKEKYGLEYNQMIKQKVDTDLMQRILEDYFSNIKDIAETDYSKLVAIFESVNS